MAPQGEDSWSADAYNKTASFVYSPAFTSPVLTLLDAQPGERIIDFGCGSGEVTLELQKTVGTGGLVVGSDSSESMIAKSKANGLQHALVADAQSIQFPPDWDTTKEFDAVFSNAALHWCKRDPAGVLGSAKSVLKPGGRFVAEMGGFTNCVGVRAALHHVLHKRGYDPDALDPWYFPSPASYKRLLESSGFEVVEITLNPRFTPLNGPLVDWLRLFCRTSWLAAIDNKEAEEIMYEVQDMCRVDCMDSDGNWAIMYTRLRFKAVLPQ
ncbi:S-adenosyl-L-methionine-dependent methyltransferase [Punctularia strigosozonata HHB-11173 SS5]|uniref:S-adenosyl-L-methionine-dependent methyltransferase n=1 Tax=Punctularia strigosozonata (strain HHB-11173) TaxID=741275 RepID=UPI00044172F4|nr:S-adenosyl-L-methionine-dependent methyltransferase [Punctularia strigosozonata HHB-11173 SS5]EIN12393.1 S-adenosyl-L-methionine-dependent methyltransferase [Punctularia strigosozonata HHB-11173 SS5]